MEQWLVAGAVVYFLTIMTPASILFFQIGMMRYLGPRDTLPEPGPVHARALKADANSRENFPLFIGLGVLGLVVEGTDTAQALLGAQMYVFGPHRLCADLYGRHPGLAVGGLYGQLDRVDPDGPCRDLNTHPRKAQNRS